MMATGKCTISISIFRSTNAYTPYNVPVLDERRITAYNFWGGFVISYCSNIECIAKVCSLISQVLPTIFVLLRMQLPLKVASRFLLQIGLYLASPITGYSREINFSADFLKIYCALIKKLTKRCSVYN